MRTLSYYTSLIPSWNASRPNFYEMVSKVVEPTVNAVAGLYKVRDSFNLSTAIGVQLDQVGEWIGRARDIVIPLENVYFSWNIVGLGWQEGYWKGPGDPSVGIVTLDDVTYRALLKAKAKANLWDGRTTTLPEIYNELTGGGTFIIDNQDMSMVVCVAGVYLTPVVEKLLVNGYVTAKPMGVRINYIVSPAPEPLFGFNLDNDFVAGFNEGYWGTPH